MHIKEFFDMSALDKLLRTWSESTHMAAVAIDNDGKSISSEVGYTDFCKKYAKKKNLKENFEFGDLLSYEFDIKISENVFGKVICGQIRSEEFDDDNLKELAKNLNEDEDMFIRTAKKVPVCPLNTIKASVSLLEESVNLLVNYDYVSKIQVSMLETIEQEADKTVELIKDLNENSSGLSKIENKQNILSLNATIEAARAGEAGKGFTVVADEVRKLASNSMQINQSIKKNIVELSKSIEMIDKARDIRLEA